MNDSVAGGLRRALAASVLALPLAAAAADKCKLSVLEMPVALVGTRAVATVGLHGVQVPLTVDTGAFFSMLTAGTAQELGLSTRPLPHGMRIEGLTGRIEARVATVPKVALALGDLASADFVVGGNEPGAGTRGLMGRNLLQGHDIEFDLANGMIRFVFPQGDCGDTSFAYWAGDTPVTVLDLLTQARAVLPPFEVAVKINGKRVRALLDTGASTILSLDAAHDAGIKDADMTPAGIVHGAGRGSGKAWTASVARVDIGGEAILNNRLAIGELQNGQDMLLGIDFFLSHRIYLSDRQQRLYVTYNGGPVFRLNKPAAEAEASASAPADADAPTDADGFSRRGAARAARHDDAGALADLDKACAMAPASALNFTRRGDVHLALRQRPQALADFDTALRLDPGQVEARMQRARLRVAAGEREAALADVQELDRSVPPQSALRADLARLYTTLDQPAQALPQWTQWLAAHPREFGRENALEARCWIRLRLGIELDAALDDCDEAISLAPQVADHWRSRGWLRLRRGELRQARDDFSRALELRPDGAWALYGRGLLALHQGVADAAATDFAAARKADAQIDAKVRRAGVAGDLALPAAVTTAAPAASASGS